MSNRPLRRGQAISPFGIGAMVDFPGPVSLIHAGLDAWPYREDNPEHDEFKVDDEERLAARLGVQYFVQPPDFRRPFRGQTQTPNQKLALPFLRFPLWHICPRCGLMHLAKLHDSSPPICQGPIATGKEKGKQHISRKTYQVRFVATCEEGHLQDFPWWEWVLQEPTPDGNSLRLRMHSSGSASLAGVTIICEQTSNQINVIKKRSLAGAFTGEYGAPSALTRLNVTCSGQNPALAIPSATRPAPGCGRDLYPMLRGSSSIYYPKVVSAIYIPPSHGRQVASAIVLELLERPRLLQAAKLVFETNDSELTGQQIERLLKKYAPEVDVNSEEFATALKNKLLGIGEQDVPTVFSDSDEQRFRREEYRLFQTAMTDRFPKANLMVETEPITKYRSAVTDFFSQVSLLHKLRETRAFTGFTRVFPDNNQSSETRRERIGAGGKPWLPAVTVRGEGIFLVVKEEAIRSWQERNAEGLISRLQCMARAANEARSRRRQEDLKPSPRFVLLHTFAHLLINQLVFDCGYGSASLRERIYVSDDLEQPMAGILIYTAAGDSEGTMGGLVRMGRPGRLEDVMTTSIDEAMWCSSDPVCMESTGQGPDNCNLAACHSCALLPETSCEEQNRLLDRGMVVGTHEQPQLGFFRTMLSKVDRGT